MNFDVLCELKSDKVSKLKGIIGGRSQPIGTAVILIPFKDPNLIIGVTFQIEPQKIPKPLRMKGMVDNGSEISIKNEVVI